MAYLKKVLNVFSFLLLIGIVGIAQAEDAPTLDEVLATQTTQVKTCPDVIYVDECKAVCPPGFELKNPLDAQGYYTCQSKTDKSLVCTYQNKVCLIKKDEILQKAIDAFKKEVDLTLKVKEPLTMFIIRVITLDPDVIQEVKDKPQYTNLATYAEGVEDAFKIIVNYSLILVVLIGLATTSFKTFEATRRKMQEEREKVFDTFLNTAKFTFLKGFLALSFFALPWMHTTSNGEKTVYPLSMDFYRKILLWGDELAENVGQVFLDVYFKASMKKLLADALWTENYYQLQLASEEISIEQLKKLVDKCYQIYDTGGKRFKDISEDELPNLPTKIDISNNPYAPTPYYCAGSDLYLSLLERRIKALKVALRISQNYILRILQDKTYWKGFYETIYQKYKEIGWIVLPLTGEFLQEKLTDEVEKALEKNKADLENFKKFLVEVGVKPTNGAIVVFEKKAKPISETYEMQKAMQKKTASELSPNFIAKAIVLLSLPPGSMIFSAVSPIVDKAGSKILDIIPIPGASVANKVLSVMGLTFLTSFMETVASAAIAYLITTKLLVLLPKLAILLTSLARLLSLMIYIAELTIVMPFKVIPLALDRPWQEVFWSITNKVIFIALIPITVLFASFFGVALLDVGNFLFLYIPQQILKLDNTLNQSVFTQVMNGIIYAVIWWVAQILFVILLARFIWNAPNIVNEWLGGLIGTRLHRTVGEEELEQKQRSIIRL